MRWVAYIPRREAGRWHRECRDDAEASGDTIVAVVDGGPGRWASAQAMVDAGEADGIIVARWAHVPREALPHVRVVGDRRDGRGRVA